MVNLINRPTWELKNMVKALSMHSWLNTNKETERLHMAKLILKQRKRKSQRVSKLLKNKDIFYLTL